MRANSTLFSLAVMACFSSAAASPSWADTRVGVAAYGDWRSDAPGVRRKMTPADMPPPLASAPAANPSQIVPRPAGAAPKVPPGFAVSEFASGLRQPRVVRIAPNGDIFVAESARRPHPRFPLGGRRFAADRNRMCLRTGLNRPFGIAFYPPGPDPRFLYVATTGQIVRYPYHNGDLQSSGPPEVVVPHFRQAAAIGRATSSSRRMARPSMCRSGRAPTLQKPCRNCQPKN